MSSFRNKLATINANKNSIKDKLIEKGIDMTNTVFDQYPAKIRQLPSQDKIADQTNLINQIAAALEDKMGDIDNYDGLSLEECTFEIPDNMMIDYITKTEVTYSSANNLYLVTGAYTDADGSYNNYYGTVWYSIDGKTWTRVKSLDTSWGSFYLWDVKTNAIFLTEYNGGGLYYSYDGITWTKTNLPNGGYAVYYNNGTLVAADSNYTNYGLYYSTDGGETWTQSNITTGSYAVYYHNNLWIASDIYSNNGILYSTNGKTWTKSNVNYSNYTIFYNNGIWYAHSSIYGGGYLLYSTNGKTWSDSNINSTYGFEISYNNELYFASTKNNGLYYSTDGKTWTQSNITIGSYMVYYNNIFIASSKYDSSNGIYYSTDGKTWTQSNITTGSYNIIYNNGIYTAYTNEGSGKGNGVYYSTDGKTWTQSNLIAGIYNIYYYRDIWIAVRGNASKDAVFYSTDGITWISVYYTFTVYSSNGAPSCFTEYGRLFINNYRLYYANNVATSASLTDRTVNNLNAILNSLN